jgi:chemotaxis protein methyltransferase CheR
MITAHTSSRLEAVSELIAENLGLHYPPERSRDMERVLGRAARVAGYPNLEAYLDSLLAAPLKEGQFELLASTLTIGETYFYRDPKVFDLIMEHFVPQMMAARPGLPPLFRIWSAGCCTGEEAYTIAILFDRMRSLARCEIDVLATDINPHFLRQARAGIYRPWAFRGSPPWLQASYFTALDGDRFELRADLRRLVNFAPLNLAELNYPSTPNRTSARDLILCRHVLMYFTPEQFSCTVRQLAQCLVEGGWLILSAAEVGHVDEPELVPTRIGDMTIFVKRTQGHHRPETLVATWKDSVGEPTCLPQWELSLNKLEQQVFGDAAAGWQTDHRHEPAPVASLAPAADQSAEPPDLLAIARTQASRGELAAAHETCNRLLQEDKMNPVIHYLRAAILQEQGAVDEAELAFKRVLYLEPDFIAAHVSLATLARNQTRPAEARRHLRNALTLAGRLSPDGTIPESDGMTARRLVHIVSSVLADQEQRIGVHAESSGPRPPGQAGAARHS